MTLFNTIRACALSSLVVFSSLAHSTVIDFSNATDQVGPITFENVIGDIDLNVTAGIFFRNSNRLNTPNNDNRRTSILFDGSLGVQGGTDTSSEVDGARRNDALVFTFSEEISFLSLGFDNVDSQDTFNFGEISLIDGVNTFTRSFTDTPISGNEFEFLTPFIGTTFAVGALLDDSSFTIDSITVTNVPEPSTLFIFSLGLIGLSLRLRRS